ncbi:MAG TPA: M42 family metallopeptidase [Firmicutes bacterium]|nr:M42 family metallopeptidase [Bacillota bacterium]
MNSSVADLLAELTGVSGPPGGEAAAAALVRRLWSPLCDEVQIDSLGNVLVLKKATRTNASPGPEKAPVLMLAAHLDEVAMMVLKVEKGGFLRVTPVGGMDPRMVTGLEVTVYGSGGKAFPGIVASTPPHLTSPEERGKVPKWPDLCVDIGYSEEEARRLISPGDRVVIAAPFVRLLDERVAGKAMDNRAGVAALTVTLQRLSRLSHAVDLCFVATTGEEIGQKGATTGTYHVAPQAGIAVDVGFGAMPGLPEHDTLELGGGPALTIGANVHPGLRRRLVQVAKKERVPVQTEVLPGSSGTDAWVMQVSRSGVPTAIVSIPLRYMHSPVETLDVKDIENTARLLAAAAADLEPEEVWGWQHEYDCDIKPE